MTLFWLALTLLTGCGGGEGGTAGGGAEACDLTLENLDGRTFVMHEAQPDQTYKENPQARVKFTQGEDGPEALYTAMSVSDVYTYHCQEPEGEGADREMYCAEKERPQDWCQALEVHEEGSCDRKTLKKLGITQEEHDKLAQVFEVFANKMSVIFEQGNEKH